MLILFNIIPNPEIGEVAERGRNGALDTIVVEEDLARGHHVAQRFRNLACRMPIKTVHNDRDVMLMVLYCVVLYRRTDSITAEPHPLRLYCTVLYCSLLPEERQTNHKSISYIRLNSICYQGRSCKEAKLNLLISINI